MTITVECGECGKGYKFRNEMGGKRFKCKNCGQPIRVRKKQADSDGGFLDGLDEMEAEAPAFDDDDGEALQRPTRRKTKASSKSRKRGKKKRRKSKKGKLSVANGLRFVLAGLLLHCLVFLLGFVLVFVPISSLVILSLTRVAAILTIIGQAMCLTAPKESKTRMLFFGVLGLQSLGFCLGLLGSAIPLLVALAVLVISSLLSVASFFLFVYTLKRLAAFVGSANGEMHAEFILYWGGGLFGLGIASFTLGGPFAVLVGIATLVISVLLLLRYIDLLGCLKDELND